MMETDEILTPVLIGIAVFFVALIVYAMGEFYGGDWQIIAEGVTKFMVVITLFAFAVYVLMRYLGRR